MPFAVKEDSVKTVRCVDIKRWVTGKIDRLLKSTTQRVNRGGVLHFPRSCTPASIERYLEAKKINPL